MEDKRKPEKIYLNLEDLDNGADSPEKKNDRLIIDDLSDGSRMGLLNIDKEDLLPGESKNRATGKHNPATNYSPLKDRMIRRKTAWGATLYVVVPMILMSIAASAFFIIGSGIEHDVKVVEPAEELREKLQLTDQQFQVIQSGAGTIQFSGEQAAIYKKPVEELLLNIEDFLDEKDCREADEVLGRLLNKGEADLERLNDLAGKLLAVEDRAETAIISELQKIPGPPYYPNVNNEPIALTSGYNLSVSDENPVMMTLVVKSSQLLSSKQLSVEAVSAGTKHNYTTVTTLYTPGESDAGDGNYTLKNEFGGGVGKIGQPNYVASAIPATGSVFASSTSWIGSDLGVALVGVTFEVPQDNTNVVITTTMEHISAVSGVGFVIHFAGTWIPVAFEDDYSLRFETMVNPYTWKEGVDAILAVLGPLGKVPKGTKSVKEAIGFATGSMKQVELVRAMNKMESTKMTETTAHLGVLDRGTYQFQVGVKARTSAVVTDYVHAAVWGHVKAIEVNQMFDAEPEPRNNNCGSYGTIEWQGGTYTGELQDCLPHGQGEWLHPSGSRYVGEYLQGQRHGQGTLYFEGHWHPEEIRYRGDWKNDMMHGYGVMYYGTGVDYYNWYEGEFQNNERHGYGTMYIQFDYGTYTEVGQWKNGKAYNVKCTDTSGHSWYKGSGN